MEDDELFDDNVHLTARGQYGQLARAELFECGVLLHLAALELEDEELAEYGDLFFLLRLSARATEPVLRFDFARLGDNESIDKFRFDKEGIRSLLVALRMPDVLSCDNRTNFSSMEGLLILLYQLAYPCRLCSMFDIFYRRPDDLSRIINCTMRWIYNRWHHLLAGESLCLSLARAQLYRETLRRHTGFPNLPIFAFVDGTLRPTCKPIQGESSLYNGMDRVHGLKYLALSTPDGMLAFVSSPFEGCRHDSTVLAQCGLPEILERRLAQDNYLYFYGDLGFRDVGRCLTAFRGAELSAEQQNFNQILNGRRTAVEWGFGRILALWASLAFVPRQKILLSPIGVTYMTAALFTNLHACLNGSMTATYFQCKAPSLTEYLA